MKKKRSLSITMNGGISVSSIVIGLISVGIIAVLVIEVITGGKKNTQKPSSESFREAIIHVLNTESELSSKESHLSDEEFLIAQEYVKEKEEELKDYNSVALTDDYSIYIDRETRALFAKNNQGMTRRLTWRTIDCNDYSKYDSFIANNDRTYCIGKNIITEYYLGEEISSFEVPFENPQIIGYYKDSVLVIDEDAVNSTLVLCTDKQNILISDSFSKLPVEIHINGLYYIDSNQSLYMYNLCTNQTTFIADDAYDLFYSSGVNFRTKEGIFRINCFVSDYGEECIKDINGDVTDIKFEKWNN